LKETAMKEKAFLALPAYANQISGPTATCLPQCARNRPLQMTYTSSSVLPHAFNGLWVEAVQGTAQYFVMLHADVAPLPNFWVDELIDLLEEHDADVMSVCLPIKSQEEVFSTGLGHPDTECHYRLTRSDARKLPRTFDGQALREVTGQEGNLLVNTGLFAARLRAGWERKVHFRFRTRIDWREDGTGRAVLLSEDWDFSNQLAALNCKVYATLEIPAIHIGTAEWDNSTHEGISPPAVGDRTNA
jgi:hypothetical protein